MFLNLTQMSVHRHHQAAQQSSEWFVTDKAATVKMKAGLFQGWYPAEGDKELPALLLPLLVFLCVCIHFYILSRSSKSIFLFYFYFLHFIQ